MDQPPEEADQQNRSLNWEESLNLFEEAVAQENNITLQIQAIVKLAHLSNYAPGHILTRAVQIVTQLLGGGSGSGCSSPLVQEAAAYCLKCIAHQGDRNARLATLIGRSDAIPITLRLLQQQQHSHGGFQKLLVKCLWSIVTFGARNRVVVVRNGGLEVVIEMLRSCDGSTRRCLLEILSGLAWLREVRRVIIGVEGLAFLVEAVGTGGMASRERAAFAVGALGVARSARRALVYLGAMQPLIKLLREGDASAKLVAGNALGVISAHVECIRPLAQVGAIPLYVDLLRRAEPVGKEIAEDVLGVLAIALVNAATIAQQLAQILTENDDKATAAAAEFLGKLSRYKHPAPFIRNSGAIPILVELVSRDVGSSSDEVKEKASGAIAELSYNAGDRAALAAAGAIPILVGLLEQSEEEMIRKKAAEALMAFSEDSSQHERMSEAFNMGFVEEIRNRLLQLRASDGNEEEEGHMGGPLRHMRNMARHMDNLEHLHNWDPY